MPTADFDALFTQHHAFAWRVLARHGVKARELEDACQEVFFALYRSLERFEGRASIRTWIYGICRRVAANFRSREKNRREGVTYDWEQVALQTDPADQFNALVLKRSMHALLEMLEELSPAQREVFVLYEIEELTMREVAASLGCPLHTAFARLYAARRALESRLTGLTRDSGEVA